jgi:hypothetical protein
MVVPHRLAYPGSDAFAEGAVASTGPDNCINAYRRDLPGGGFVALEVQPMRTSWWRHPRYEGRVLVERRSTSRDGDHASPVIARATGDTVEEVVQALLPAARCNEAIGAAFLRLGARRPVP